MGLYRRMSTTVRKTSNEQINSNESDARKKKKDTFDISYKTKLVNLLKGFKNNC